MVVIYQAPPRVCAECGGSPVVRVVSSPYVIPSVDGQARPGEAVDLCADHNLEDRPYPQPTNATRVRLIYVERN